MTGGVGDGRKKGGDRFSLGGDLEGEEECSCPTSPCHAVPDCHVVLCPLHRSDESEVKEKKKNGSAAEWCAPGHAVLDLPLDEVPSEVWERSGTRVQGAGDKLSMDRLLAGVTLAGGRGEGWDKVAMKGAIMDTISMWGYDAALPAEGKKLAVVLSPPPPKRPPPVFFFSPPPLARSRPPEEKDSPTLRVRLWRRGRLSTS